MTTRPRLLAIGDIHGCRRALEELADFVGLAADDTLVTLGDYVDRGPDSKGVIDFLLELRQSHRLIHLLGNHEIMMEQARHRRKDLLFWLSHGGDATLASYGADSLDSVPREHWDFLEEAAPYHETERHFFVHANVHPDLPLEEQPEWTLHWEPFGEPDPHVSGKTMICGHTSQRSGEILSVGHAICIDTFAHGGGWLTCLDVETGRYWQCNEQGERRAGVDRLWSS